MTSGIASLILLAYFRVVQRRSRTTRDGGVCLRRAYAAAAVAICSFFLAAMLATIYNAFRTEAWIHPFACPPGIIDIGGAMMGMAFGLYEEITWRKTHKGDG